MTAGGLRTIVATGQSRVAAPASQGCGKVAVKQRDGKDGVVREVNLEASRIRLRHVRHRLPRDLVRDVRVKS